MTELTPNLLKQTTNRVAEQLLNIASVSYIEATVLATAYALCLARIVAAISNTERDLKEKMEGLSEILMNEALSTLKRKQQRS